MHYKLIIIGGLGVLVSAAFGYFFSGFALTNDYFFLLAAAILALVYLALFTVRMLIISSVASSLIFIALDMLVFITSFLMHFSIWIIAAAAIAAFWLFGAWRAGRGAVNNMLRLRLHDLGASFIKPSFRAIIFLTIAIYFSFVNPNQLAVSRGFIASSLQTATSGASTAVIQQLIGQDVPPETSAQIVERAITTVHALLNRLLSILPQELKAALLVGLGIIVFLLVNSVTNLLVPVVTGFVWVCIQLLLRAGFIKIELVRKEVEVITI